MGGKDCAQDAERGFTIRAGATNPANGEGSVRFAPTRQFVDRPFGLTPYPALGQAI